VTLGFTRIPPIQGPPLTLNTVCLFELEDGSGFIERENGTGALQLEMCNQPIAVTFLIELENGLGAILLENDQGFIALERP
jgi:hypothetical protein